MLSKSLNVAVCLICRWMSRSRVNLSPVDDPSVKHVKAESQHLSAASLDECFDVFTQQERVCDVKSHCTVFMLVVIEKLQLAVTKGFSLKPLTEK